MKKIVSEIGYAHHKEINEVFFVVGMGITTQQHSLKKIGAFQRLRVLITHLLVYYHKIIIYQLYINKLQILFIADMFMQSGLSIIIATIYVMIQEDLPRKHAYHWLLMQCASFSSHFATPSLDNCTLSLESNA